MAIGCSRQPHERGSAKQQDTVNHSNLSPCSVPQKPDSGPPASFESASYKEGWNEEAAASYLNARAVWWIQWKGAERDQRTFCVSCHTSIPYILSQPALQSDLHETEPSANERAIVADVTKRVRLWKNLHSYYASYFGQKNLSAESRSTEAILNSVVLASSDSETGHLSNDTRSAFNILWSLQLTSGEDKGAWLWQQFNLQPWEATDSRYYGATLAAIAVGIAPDDYRLSPEIQQHVELLREYLLGDYTSQSLLNQTFLLLASAKLPGLLTPSQKKDIVSQLVQKQHSDGGWSLPSLVSSWRGWHLTSLLSLAGRRSDGSPEDKNSDGDATAIVTYAFEQVGVSLKDPHLSHGLAWLRANQDLSDGAWHADSLNLKRDPTSNIGQFMSDEATGYAVLALSIENSEARDENGAQVDKTRDAP